MREVLGIRRLYIAARTKICPKTFLAECVDRSAQFEFNFLARVLTGIGCRQPNALWRIYWEHQGDEKGIYCTFFSFKRGDL